jgi:hypothetical protein
MAVKKTIKKRRATKKSRIISIESIIDTLRTSAEFSTVNNQAINRLNKSVTAVTKQQKLLASNQERVNKARAAVNSAKSPAAKEKAKIRLGLAQIKYKEVKTDLSIAVVEEKKAEHLARDLHKAFETAQTKMRREYDKKARSLEKTIDKPTRQRRSSKKKPVQDS